MEEKKINLELTPEIAEGKYANLAIVNHSPTEFVMDFVGLMPGVPKAKINSRVVMNPLHVKRLAMALQENIKKYESQFGIIEDIEKKTFHFNDFGVKGEA